MKTLYLWDLADTLFGERWNVKKTGSANFDAYIESLDYNLKTIDAKTYEWNYERPFKDGLMELSLLPGFFETLSWTKNNAIFTTGNREQLDWRAEVFIKQGVTDIRPLFKKIYSTFDYGNTNIKTEQMFADILQQESATGTNFLVYSDNKLENCEAFIKAAEKVSKITTRTYHINSNGQGFNKVSENYFEVPGLLEFLKNEQSGLEKPL